MVILGLIVEAGAVPGLTRDFLPLKRRYFPRRFNTGLTLDEVLHELKGNEVLQKNFSRHLIERSSTPGSHCQASSLRDCSPSESGHFSSATRTPQTPFRHLSPRGRAGAWTVAGSHPLRPNAPHHPRRCGGLNPAREGTGHERPRRPAEGGAIEQSAGSLLFNAAP
jgi:hypothetical protein